MAEKLYADCSYKLKETKDEIQNATEEIKEKRNVLSSLDLENEEKKIKDVDYATYKVDMYQKVVDAANETIGKCVSGLENMEVQMRKERVEAMLMGERRFAESTFLSKKSACIKMHNVYACGFFDENGNMSFVDKSYPLVSDSVYLTGIQLGVRNDGRTLVVDHLNYAVFDEHGAPLNVYRDEFTPENEVTEHLPEGRLSESCMNDTKEFSGSFEIDSLAGGNDDTPLLSIVINMGPRLYESIKGFQYIGDWDDTVHKKSTKMEVDIKAVPTAEDDEDTSDSSTNGNNVPTYYKPSEDPATRSADRMLYEEFLYTRDLHKVLTTIQNKGDWDKPLSISTTSSTEEPLKVNPVLEGLSKAIGDDREQAIAALPYDIQKAIVKVVCHSAAPNKLITTDAVENTISYGLKHDKDVNIAKTLLEDEDYGTKYALAITKEIMSSTGFLGGMGLDHSSRIQKGIVEGMRSDYGWGDRHSTLECLRQEELAEAIRDLLCTEFGAKMTPFDVKTLKSKPSYAIQRQNRSSSIVKKRRASPPEKGEGASEKKRRLESGKVDVTPPSEEEGVDDEITMVSMGTVIPPPLFNEPKEITSSSAMTEMIAEYSSVIARYIAKSPLSSIRMASVVDIVFTLKKLLSVKVSRKSANTVFIEPVEIDDNESISLKMYKKLTSRDMKNMAHLMKQHKSTDSVENGMRAILTMRRLSEERNAYRHLIEVLILENVVGILSGEGVTYSNALYNAAVWYMKVVIRNRICGNRNLVDNVVDYVAEVSLQVNTALDWLFKFNIDHKLLLERNIGNTAFAELAPSRDIETPLFKPGGRFYALFGGEDTLPMKMVKMPSSTSILKTVGVFNTKTGLKDYMLCINNYETSNMFMLSMADINMVESVNKLDNRNAHDRWRQESSYLYATPSFQLAKDVRNIPLFNEIVGVGHWDEFAAVPRGDEARISKKPSKGVDVVSSSMAMPFLFRGSYKDSWKNMPLFGENKEGVFQFRYEANPKGRLMTSIVDQALSVPQDKKSLGNNLSRIANIIKLYTKKDMADIRDTHTLSRAYLAVYWKPVESSSKEEEVCRFDCIHSGYTNLNGVDLYAALDFYTIKGPKNSGTWKRFIATGSMGKAMSTTSESDGEDSTPLLKVDEEEDKHDEDKKKKKVGDGGNKYTIQKLPKQRVLMANDVTHENVAPFMSKMYNIVRQGQNIRERFTDKIVRSKNVDKKSNK